MYFQPKKTYHIYNRGINRQNIFFEERNYLFFRDKMAQGLKPHCNILAWCLMPNHFHIMVQVKGGMGERYYGLNKGIQVLLRSYTRAINIQEERTGSLFTQKTKGKLLEDRAQEINCFHYIHRNPLQAGLETHPGSWKHSSLSVYQSQRSEDPICDVMLTVDILGLTDLKKTSSEVNQALIFF